MEAEDYAAGCCFSLMCQEDGADLGDSFSSEVGADLLLMYSGIVESDDDDEEYIDHLVSKEKSFCTSPESSLSCSSANESSPSMASADWFQCARRATVKWILETREHFGFCHRTAYVAIAYFDRFSRRRCIDVSVMPWATSSRLLAMACISLAAKMDEYQAPALSEFRTGDEYDFCCGTVQRMELFVLSTLDWRMGAVTPFDYLPCLTSRLRRGNGGGGGHVAVKAAALIFSAAEVASVLDYRPSTVAIAAVLAATHGVLTRETLESKMSSLSPSCLLDKEDVYPCYNMMLGDPSSTPTNKPTKRSARDSIDIASFSVVAAMNNNKRVRLDLPGTHR